MTKKTVIFIGPPGAGKGSQAVLLEREFDFRHIESSLLIEKKFENAKPGDPDYDEVKKEKEQFDKGILISPLFVARLVMEEVRKLSIENKNIVFSGSPRTLFEAEKELPVIIEEYGKDNVYVVHMPVSEGTSIERNSHRRICKAQRHPIPWGPGFEDLKMCPEDGSPLISRGILDDPETIKTRLQQYKSRTEPVLKHIQDKFGLKIHFVDGEKSINEGFETIKKILGL